jgi:hypothetical protein
MKIISEEEWDEMSYAECKKRDEAYKTPERSPMHRSTRFPVLWAKEKEFVKQWYISCGK